MRDPTLHEDGLSDQDGDHVGLVRHANRHLDQFQDACESRVYLHQHAECYDDGVVNGHHHRSGWRSISPYMGNHCHRRYRSQPTPGGHDDLDSHGYTTASRRPQYF